MEGIGICSRLFKLSTLIAKRPLKYYQGQLFGHTAQTFLLELPLSSKELLDAKFRYQRQRCSP